MRFVMRGMGCYRVSGVPSFGQFHRSKIRMIITCPHCSTRYPVKPGAFASGPRKVRCAKCGHSWEQHPLEEDGAEEASAAAARASVASVR